MEEEQRPFEVDHAKTSRSICKKCKNIINVNVSLFMTYIMLLSKSLLILKNVLGFKNCETEQKSFWGWIYEKLASHRVLLSTQD